MQAEEGASKAGSVLDKIKDALPFGVLPSFDLAVTKDDAGARRCMPLSHVAHGLRMRFLLPCTGPPLRNSWSPHVGQLRALWSDWCCSKQPCTAHDPRGLDNVSLRADMGPNEVDKELLGTVGKDSNNPFDTAMPGTSYFSLTLRLAFPLLVHTRAALVRAHARFPLPV